VVDRLEALRDERIYPQNLVLHVIFLLHALSSLPFVPLLIFAPAWTTSWLVAGSTLADAGIMYARIYGLGVLLIAMLAWRARTMSAEADRIAVARMLPVIEAIGVALCFTLPSGPDWRFAFWVSLGFHAFFAAAYG